MSRVLVHLRARVDQRFFDPVEEGAFVQSGEPARPVGAWGSSGVGGLRRSMCVGVRLGRFALHSAHLEPVGPSRTFLGFFRRGLQSCVAAELHRRLGFPPLQESDSALRAD